MYILNISYANITGLHINVKYYSIVGGESHKLARTIQEAM